MALVGVRGADEYEICGTLCIMDDPISVDILEPFLVGRKDNRKGDGEKLVRLQLPADELALNTMDVTYR